jgi:uncharacterized protein (TIGR03382 family)
VKRWLVLGTSIACCGAAPSLRPSILNGSASGSSDDATIMLVEIDPATNQRVGLCTAALVADRLVLTARHCVARTNGDAVACSSDGTPVFGGEIRSNVDAKSLYVFTGSTRPPGIGDTGTVDLATWKPASRGEAILDDGSANICDHDLAFVLLDKPITGIDHATIRVDRGVAVGETLRTVGWGVTQREIEPGTRQQRGGVRVTRVGPDDASPVLTPSEVMFGESICLGDSGGPVFAEGSGAIIGVVSRGGNGVDPTSGGPSVSCVDAKNVATRLAPFRDFVRSAFTRANASPKTEPEEDEGCSTSGQHGSGALLVLLGLVIARRFKR